MKSNSSCHPRFSRLLLEEQNYGLLVLTLLREKLLFIPILCFVLFYLIFFYIRTFFSSGNFFVPSHWWGILLLCRNLLQQPPARSFHLLAPLLAHTSRDHSSPQIVWQNPYLLLSLERVPWTFLERVLNNVIIGK